MAKFGIALEWGSRGLEFESQHSDHIGASFIWLAPFFYKSRNTLMPLRLRSQSKPLRWVRVAFRCETGNNGIYTAAMLQTRRKDGKIYSARTGRSIPALVLFAMTRYNKTINDSTNPNLERRYLYEPKS